MAKYFLEHGRTLGRSQALQILFQAEILRKTPQEVCEGEYLLSKGPLQDFAKELAFGTYENLDKIDEQITAVANNWKLERMPGADRNIMRIAVFEMQFTADDLMTTATAINEAVEMAKAYGTDESASFVNGVLGAIARGEGYSHDELTDAADKITHQIALENPEPVVIDETEE